METELFNLIAISSSFLFILLAEIGDKTQLATIALAVEHNAPISVALGAIAGFAVSTTIAVILGKKLSTGLIQRIAAITFIIIGTALLNVI